MRGRDYIDALIGAAGCLSIFALIAGVFISIEIARQTLGVSDHAWDLFGQISSIVGVSIFLAVIHWHFAVTAEDMSWALAFIDTVLIISAVESGGYWSVFDRGSGWMTLNRLSCYLLLLSAVWMPIALSKFRYLSSKYMIWLLERDKNKP